VGLRRPSTIFRASSFPSRSSEDAHELPFPYVHADVFQGNVAVRIGEGVYGDTEPHYTAHSTPMARRKSAQIARWLVRRRSWPIEGIVPSYPAGPSIGRVLAAVKGLEQSEATRTPKERRPLLMLE